jgi:ankyrin repeat protein
MTHGTGESSARRTCGRAPDDRLDARVTSATLSGMSGGANLHEACYLGQVDLVRALLGAGADPNEPASLAGRDWVSSAGRCPKPLNCVAIAWAMTDNHVEIARILIERGAIVDETVLEDHSIETTGGAADKALDSLLQAAATVDM